MLSDSLKPSLALALNEYVPKLSGALNDHAPEPLTSTSNFLSSSGLITSVLPGFAVPENFSPAPTAPPSFGAVTSGASACNWGGEPSVAASGLSILAAHRYCAVPPLTTPMAVSSWYTGLPESPG